MHGSIRLQPILIKKLANNPKPRLRASRLDAGSTPPARENTRSYTGSMRTE